MLPPYLPSETTCKPSPITRSGFVHRFAPWRTRTDVPAGVTRRWQRVRKRTVRL